MHRVGTAGPKPSCYSWAWSNGSHHCVSVAVKRPKLKAATTPCVSHTEPVRVSHIARGVSSNLEGEHPLLCGRSPQDLPTTSAHILCNSRSTWMISETGAGTPFGSGGVRLFRRRRTLTARSSSSGMEWTCIQGCGACCQLDKGPLAPPIETILRDSHELDVSMWFTGTDIDAYCVVVLTAYHPPLELFHECADGCEENEAI